MPAICLEESLSSCSTPKLNSGAGLPSASSIAHERGQFVGVLQAGDALQRRFQRRKTLFLHQIGVHAGGKVVAVLLLKSAFGGAGCRVQLLPQQVAVALAQQREGPRPAHLIARNGVVLDPVAAGVLVEVRAGIGGLVDGGEIEAHDGRGRRGFAGVGLRRRGSLRQGGSGRQQQNGNEANAIHRMSSWKRRQPARSICARSAFGWRRGLSLKQPIRFGLQC